MYKFFVGNSYDKHVFTFMVGNLQNTLNVFINVIIIKTLIFILILQGNWGTNRLRNLPKTIQLVKMQNQDLNPGNWNLECRILITSLYRVGLQLWVCETHNLFLHYLFINYCIMYLFTWTATNLLSPTLVLCYKM